MPQLILKAIRNPLTWLLLLLLVVGVVLYSKNSTIHSLAEDILDREAHIASLQVSNQSQQTAIEQMDYNLKSLQELLAEYEAREKSTTTYWKSQLEKSRTSCEEYVQLLIGGSTYDQDSIIPDGTDHVLDALNGLWP